MATWLRLGELKAEQQECTDYNEAQFRRVLREIRGLTQAPVVSALQKTQQLCNAAGAVLVLIKPFPKNLSQWCRMVADSSEGCDCAQRAP